MDSKHHFRSCPQGKECQCEIGRYWIIASITLATLAIEIVGGVISNSLSLISDALHVGIDLTGIIIALSIEYWVRDGNNKKKEMIRGRGGVISSLILLGSVVVIGIEAMERFTAPSFIQSKEMIVFAVIGLIGNAISLQVMHASHENHITNTTLTAHIISDLVQSIAVVSLGCLILWTGKTIIDPIGSLAMIIFLGRIGLKNLIKSFKSIVPS